MVYVSVGIASYDIESEDNYSIAGPDGVWYHSSSSRIGTKYYVGLVGTKLVLQGDSSNGEVMSGTRNGSFWSVSPLQIMGFGLIESGSAIISNCGFDGKAIGFAECSGTKTNYFFNDDHSHVTSGVKVGDKYYPSGLLW